MLINIGGHPALEGHVVIQRRLLAGLGINHIEAAENKMNIARGFQLVPGRLLRGDLLQLVHHALDDFYETVFSFYPDMSKTFVVNDRQDISFIELLILREQLGAHRQNLQLARLLLRIVNAMELSQIDETKLPGMKQKIRMVHMTMKLPCHHADKLHIIVPMRHLLACCVGFHHLMLKKSRQVAKIIFFPLNHILAARYHRFPRAAQVIIYFSHFYFSF